MSYLRVNLAVGLLGILLAVGLILYSTKRKEDTSMASFDIKTAYTVLRTPEPVAGVDAGGNPVTSQAPTESYGPYANLEVAGAVQDALVKREKSAA